MIVTKRKNCGYGQAYNHKTINSVTRSAGAESLINMQSTLDNVPITRVSVNSFMSLATNLPSAYSKPTIKGLVTKVPSGYALISNITFGGKTIQFMAVDGKNLSENQAANPMYISSRINNKSLRPVIFPSLSNLKTSQKTMIDAYAGSIWFALFMWELNGRIGVFDTSHVYLSILNVNIDNAFWNGYYMTYGVGYGSIDVVGHETGHGIIQSLGGLEYESESGGLNESIADIIGVCFEKYYDMKNNKNLFDWTVGEDIYAGGFRSFSNPKINGQPTTYKGKYWKSTSNPNEYNDYGGVHTNSGVNNYFFYLTATAGKGINDNKVAYNVKVAFPMFMLMKLIYLSLKGEGGYNKITPLSTYSQYANKIIINTPLFLSSNPTLPNTLRDSVIEGFIAVGIIKRGKIISVDAKKSNKVNVVDNVQNKISSRSTSNIILGFILIVLLILFVLYMMKRHRI
jgi:hypothetical protein